MSKNETKAIVLLSGGLDSVVSLALEKNVTLALTFDYGQKSAAKEIEASSKIAKYYGIEHKVIKLDWLKEITHTALCSNEEVPTGDALKNSDQSAKSVWVPNRNGLFLNIAGAFADGKAHLVIGASCNGSSKDAFKYTITEFTYAK